jgi:antirepressor (fragment)
MSQSKILQVIHEQKILGKTIQCYGTFEEPLFLAKDVAEWIGLAKQKNGKYNISRFVKNVSKKQKGIRIAYTPGGNQETIVLTEYGLYEVLMKSRLEESEPFREKIVEMLRDLRRHGIAIDEERIKNEIELSDAYRSLMSERNLLEEERDRLQEERDNLEELRNSEAHMRAYYNVNIQDRGTIDIGQVAALLERPGFGRNNLYRFLRSAHILMNNNRLYQRYIGPFQYVRAASYNTNEGTHASYKPVVNQRGLDLIIRRLIDYGFINEEPANTNIESFLESQEEASSSD